MTKFKVAGVVAAVVLLACMADASARCRGRRAGCQPCYVNYSDSCACTQGAADDKGPTPKTPQTPPLPEVEDRGPLVDLKLLKVAE